MRGGLSPIVLKMRTGIMLITDRELKIFSQQFLNRVLCKNMNPIAEIYPCFGSSKITYLYKK